VNPSLQSRPYENTHRMPCVVATTAAVRWLSPGKRMASQGSVLRDIKSFAEPRPQLLPDEAQEEWCNPIVTGPLLASGINKILRPPLKDVVDVGADRVADANSEHQRHVAPKKEQIRQIGHEREREIVIVGSPDRNRANRLDLSSRV